MLEHTPQFLKECNLSSPEMQKMMGQIAEVLNNKPELEGFENLDYFTDYFQYLLEAGFRRLKYTDRPVNKEYFEWLYEWLYERSKSRLEN